MPPNLARAVVQASTHSPHEWMALHVDTSSKVFSCESVVFASGVVTPCPGAPASPTT
jgi:hypothetical protein